MAKMLRFLCARVKLSTKRNEQNFVYIVREPNSRILQKKKKNAILALEIYTADFSSPEPLGSLVSL